VPDGNILHGDPMARNTGLSATDIRRSDDPMIERLSAHASRLVLPGTDIVSTETNRSSCTAHHNGEIQPRRASKRIEWVQGQ